ncbi:MAG TPA: TonB-dependent receptor [Vicinamibacterales bacterium]
MRLRPCVVMVALLALVFGAASTSTAQVLYGSIVGKVTDAQGASVPGAAVSIVSKETNLTREATTTGDGSYSLLNVLPGSYELKVSLQGFREFVRTGVPVTVGQISRVDVTLEVGTLSETVTVASAVQLLQTDKAEVATELKSTEITAMPLSAYRNYQSLINLVPGATPARFNNAETDTPARSMTTYVNGQNSYTNSTRTDGATNVNIWLPNHNMYVSPAETIDTVNVSTSNFDAEQGAAGGAAITVITKSGTNEFRGSAFEFHNNEKLNANPFYFGGLRESKPDKVPVTRNIYGGTIGGPIKRNRLFFFGSYERFKEDRSLQAFYSVPDERLRNGDFSQALNTNGSLQLIYDPLTGNPDGTGRSQFPNNQIPADRISNIARQLVEFYPLPNTPGTGAGGLTNNYVRQEDRVFDRHNTDVKINFNRTSAHQIWGKFSYMDATVDDRTYFIIPDPDGSGDGGLTKVYAATFGQTWTLSPTLLMDSTFGFQRQDQEVIGPDQALGNFGLEVLGIPGTNDQGTGDPRYGGIPEFRTGFRNLGNFEGWMPIYRDERTYSFTTNVTKVKGAHEFRGGYLVNFLYLDHWQPETDNPRGRFDFGTRGVTALNGGQTRNFYNQWANFLLGLPGTISKSVQAELMTGREWQHALFFRDRWTVSSKLTLDLGLRWEYYPIMKRADRGLERLDLETLEVILGGRGGNPDNVGLSAGKDNFAPRVGVVYRLNDATVFRTGYGITYNPMGWSRPLRGSHYPLTIASQFFDSNQFQPFGSLETGIPFIPPPDQSTGRVPLDLNAMMRTPEVGNIDRGTIQTWNLTVERRLPGNFSVDVAYVGAKGDGGYADLDINAPTELGGGDDSRPYAPMGRRIPILSWGQRLITRYHSLQVGFNRPFQNGLLVKGAYTLGKSMNLTDEDGWTGVSYNTPSQYHRNYALAGFDRKHNLQVGFVYQLPWRMGEGSGGGILKAIISDWQVNGIFGAFSGTPFTVTANGATVNTPSNMQTADQVGPVRKVGEVGASGVYFDPSAWAQPEGVRFGNTGRNAFRGPGGVNLDFSLFRSIPLGGRRALEFRAEAFNITNTPKFANPNGDVNSGSFMQILGTLNGYSERQIRLGVRFAF